MPDEAFITTSAPVQKEVGPAAVAVAENEENTVKLTVAVETQPARFVTLYLMVSLPEATAVTTPAGVIEAMAGLLVLHTPEGVTSASGVDTPAQTEVVPVIAATTVAVLTVITLVTEAVPQPPLTA